MKKGTIPKVINDNFSKDEINELWKLHNQTLAELKNPAETYTRYTSDLIKTLRDTSEKLILAEAIPGLTRKDTASYCWQKLKERNIPYAKSNFYRYFSEEQKRDWQTDTISDEPDAHKHEFVLVGSFADLGEVKRCRCGAAMIDGRILEPKPEDDQDKPLKAKKELNNYEEENESLIVLYEEYENLIKQIRLKLRTTSWLNTIPKEIADESKYVLKKAILFCSQLLDDRNTIPTLVQFLAVNAILAETKTHAATTYVEYLKKFGSERRKEAVKNINLFSSKQLLKFGRGQIKELHPLYDPKNKEEAQKYWMHGTQCNHCGSWRVGWDRIKNKDWNEGDPVHLKYETKLRCFACLSPVNATTEVLPYVKSNVSQEWESQTQ